MEPFVSPKLDLDDGVSVSIAAKKGFNMILREHLGNLAVGVCHVDLQQSLGM